MFCAPWPPLTRGRRNRFIRAHVATGLAPGPGGNWRFRVPDGEEIIFDDGCFGPQRFVAGARFWGFCGVAAGMTCRRTSFRVVADDAAMGITEVVRGEDLLRSTARQAAPLPGAGGGGAPAFYHCPLVTDEHGVKEVKNGGLAKRHDALSLRRLRAEGATPEGIRQGWGASRPGAAGKVALGRRLTLHKGPVGWPGSRQPFNLSA